MEGYKRRDYQIICKGNKTRNRTDYQTTTKYKNKTKQNENWMQEDQNLPKEK